ncbi:hypothetical protein ABE65_004730 [Fictibacillus phosphorivorans]|uniref:Uncharacterized protein n=1 Tax=Fictibacillus phosphorivorans TaxID=1221500 RepID=A0A160IKW1_9BACL|nr:hypothetical protein ABE65_004730 [Fictibacillus phosphorivorans]
MRAYHLITFLARQATWEDVSGALLVDAGAPLSFLWIVAFVFFITCKLIGAQGARLLRDRWAGETLKSETSECGSPPCPAESE